MSEVATKTQKPREMLIEWIDQQNSGFIQEGTKGLASENQIRTGTVSYLPTTSTIRKKDKEGRIVNVKIRYIKGVDTILVSEQEERKIGKSAIPSNDNIPIEKGTRLVKEEGDLAFFNYVSECSWNEDSPYRIPTVQPLIRVLKVDVKMEAANERKFLQADAITIVKGLVTKTAKGYEYQESKIDSLTSVLNLSGSNYMEKVKSITDYAELNPLNFLELVTKLNDDIVLNISHALELDLIRIDGANVLYIGDSKVVANLGKQFETAKQGKKVEALSELFKTPENAEKYQELKAKLEILKENNLKK